MAFRRRRRRAVRAGRLGGPREPDRAAPAVGEPDPRGGMRVWLPAGRHPRRRSAGVRRGTGRLGRAGILRAAVAAPADIAAPAPALGRVLRRGAAGSDGRTGGPAPGCRHPRRSWRRRGALPCGRFRRRRPPGPAARRSVEREHDVDARRRGADRPGRARRSPRDRPGDARALRLPALRRRHRRLPAGAATEAQLAQPYRAAPALPAAGARSCCSAADTRSRPMPRPAPRWLPSPRSSVKLR